eukprot:CAMPEP_0197041796 /NCGR_PEP_ID=MMETSP1384-20130603/18281_1 /TAXON_ID=29189 /ORGANISM="Ammonia sp." /LENGTH=222 /DNA_ID=CAMNT_0042472779 /DNA_START=31 /DNA_END=699 /DNA_ORIENTATION=-
MSMQDADVARFITFLVEETRDLVVSGFIRQNCNHHLPDPVGYIIKKHCKHSKRAKSDYQQSEAVVCSFSRYGSRSWWDDEESSSSHWDESVVICLNGRIVVKYESSSTATNAYGRETHSSNNRECVNDKSIDRMEKLLSILAKLPAKAAMSAKDCFGDGDSFADDSYSWKFNNLYQLSVRKNGNYATWNEDSVQRMRKLMDVLTNKYQVEFHGAESQLHKLL